MIITGYNAPSECSFLKHYFISKYRPRGVAFSVRAWIAEGRARGFNLRPGQTKEIKISIGSLLSTQNLGVREKTGWPAVKIMCLGKVTRHPVDCCFREQAR